MSIGPHVILSSPEALAWARRAPIVKQLDGTDALALARPDAVRVFRQFLPTQTLSDPQGTVNAVLAGLGSYRHPNLYVELWNELHPSFGQLQSAVMLLHRSGIKVMKSSCCP